MWKLKNKETQKGYAGIFQNAHPEIIAELNETKALSDELGEKIIAAAREYVK